MIQATTTISRNIELGQLYLPATQTQQLTYKPGTMGEGLFRETLPRKQPHPAVSEPCCVHDFSADCVHFKQLPLVELLFATRQ